MSSSRSIIPVSPAWQYYEGFDLLNTEIADELFGTPGADEADGQVVDQEMLEMRQELWQGVCEDLPKDLTRVLDLLSVPESLELGQKEAHRVAGYCGNSGLHRMGLVLRDIQHERILPAELAEVLHRLPLWAQESLSAMRQRFPALKEL